MKTQTKGKWRHMRHSKPPKQGWYHCVRLDFPHPMLRWWNGRHWSLGVLQEEGADVAKRMANIPAKCDETMIIWRPLDETKQAKGLKS